MIAQKLKYYRTMQRITQRDLALCAGVKAGAIGKIEAKGSNVTLAIALKLARALEVRVEQLVGELSEDERHEMYLANQRIRESRKARRLELQRRRREQRKLLRASQ